MCVPNHFPQKITRLSFGQAERGVPQSHPGFHQKHADLGRFGRGYVEPGLELAGRLAQMRPRLRFVQSHGNVRDFNQ